MTETLSTFNSRLSDLLMRRPVILQLLRFGAIGALNTALDYIILNYITKALGVTDPVQLAVLNVVGFTAAILQSYLWNRAWAFDTTSSTPLQNAYRLVLVGGLGFTAFVAVILGAAFEAMPLFYLLILLGFVITEFALWMLFDLNFSANKDRATVQFAAFLIVSIIGLLINSFIVYLATSVITPTLEVYVNADTIKNVAKAMATCVSLVWNFMGYKLIVFKK